MTSSLWKEEVERKAEVRRQEAGGSQDGREEEVDREAKVTLSCAASVIL